MILKKVESNLSIDPTTGTYYVRMRRAGKKPLYESLDTQNKKTARELKDKRIREYLGHSPKRVLHRLFKDESAALMEVYPKTVKPRTSKRVGSVLKHHLNPYWGSRFCGEVTPESWLTYLESQEGRNLFNDYKAMCLVLGFAFENKRLDNKPKLFNPKKNSDVSKEYSDEEIQKIMDESDGTQRLINYIALKMGPREGEILSLKWPAINYKRKTIKFDGKTGPRESVAPEVILDLLKQRQKESVSEWVFSAKTDPSKPLDTSTRDHDWTAARDRAQVKGRFHDFRHTAITRMLRAKMPANWVAKQVGSSVRTILAIYDKMKVQEVPEIAESVQIEGETGFFMRGLAVENET